MRTSFSLKVLCGCSVLLSAATLCAQQTFRNEMEGEAFSAHYALIGQVQPRDAKDIRANNWSIGAETMDRDYSTYAAWRTYLGPLGAKHARLQSGWMRTDKGDGRYDFSWLDPAVKDMNAQGVAPWMSLGYGNPAYEGGGVARRDSTLPEGKGRVAWFAYVKAVATRYRGLVTTFEIWNEPDLNLRITPEAYGQFAYDTARVIKSVQPNAAILFGAFTPGGFGSHQADFARDSLATFVRLGGRGYANAVTYHAYTVNPDDVYPAVEVLRKTVASIDPTLELRQGECGAPSLNQQHYAFSNMWWTEQDQAKWGLRRMMGDAGRSIPSSWFTMTEMHFPVAAETRLSFKTQKESTGPVPLSAKHSKGLLETRRYAPGTPEDDRTVVREKMGYVAMQAVTSIFDDRLKAAPANCTLAGDARDVGPLAIFTFQTADGRSALAMWRTQNRPGLDGRHFAVTLQCKHVHFGAVPSYVDLLTRAVYTTKDVIARDGDSTVVVNLPVYDSPVLLVESSLVNAR